MFAERKKDGPLVYIFLCRIFCWENITVGHVSTWCILVLVFVVHYNYTWWVYIYFFLWYIFYWLLYYRVPVYYLR